ncbi:hypothetical protein HZB03_03815 [Candidatus Woesearchaeota archaeon]|nr:hypothetical protein [Candidatus Woesearchaeota archaeon]
MWVDKGGTPLWGRHIGGNVGDSDLLSSSRAWRGGAGLSLVTTLSGRAVGVTALEMIRAMLLSSDRVEHRGGGGKISNSNYFRTTPPV